MLIGRLILPVLLLAGLTGCSTVSQPPLSRGAPAALPAATASPAAARYHCDNDIDFTVRFVEDTAVLEAGSHGNDVLLRDAGGATPQQTVYSNARMRAEFGLGVSGDEAILHYASPALTAHCRRQ